MNEINSRIYDLGEGEGNKERRRMEMGQEDDLRSLRGKEKEK